MSKNRLILIILILALVIVAGFWYFKIIRPQDKGITPKNNTTETTSQPVNNEVVDTTNWKTYRNEDLGFEIKYPALLSNTGQDKNDTFFFDKNHNYILHTEVIRGKLDPSKINSMFGSVNSKDIEQIEMNGVKAYRFKEGDAGCGGYDYRLPLTTEEHLKLFFVTCDDTEFVYEKEIVSSLKFLERPVNAGNWKTYKNEELGLEIKYPNSWFVTEENDSYTKEKFIIFSNFNNECDKSSCPKDYLAFFLRVYSNSDTKIYSEFINLKSKNEKLATSKEIINFSVDKKINFFVISEQKKKVDETADILLPSASAFLVDNSHSYMFYIATEIPSGSKGQKVEIEVLKEALKFTKSIK